MSLRLRVVSSRKLETKRVVLGQIQRTLHAAQGIVGEGDTALSPLGAGDGGGQVAGGGGGGGGGHGGGGKGPGI